MSDKVVVFDNDGSGELGLKFFKNFRVIINWTEKELMMTPEEEYDYSIIKGFGFSPSLDEENLLVSFVYEGSEARKAGIKPGDRIIKLDGVDYSNITQNQWCELLDKGFENETDTLTVSILRDDKIVDFTLYKSVILD